MLGTLRSWMLDTFRLQAGSGFARDAASTFYTNLQAELGRSDSGVAAPSRGALQAILAQRDQINTLLARSDAAAADRLTNVYTAYRQAVGTSRGQGGPPARER